MHVDDRIHEGYPRWRATIPHVRGISEGSSSSTTPTIILTLKLLHRSRSSLLTSRTACESMLIRRDAGRMVLGTCEGRHSHCGIQILRLPIAAILTPH